MRVNNSKFQQHIKDLSEGFRPDRQWDYEVIKTTKELFLGFKATTWGMSIVLPDGTTAATRQYDITLGILNPSIRAAGRRPRPIPNSFNQETIMLNQTAHIVLKNVRLNREDI